MLESLHAHTTTSDGCLTHQELLAAAAKYNIAVIAFTDHDAVMPIEIFRELKQEERPAVNWISGIEISSGLPEELGGKPYGGFHIVGLFVNPENAAIVRYCALAKDDRVRRMQAIVRNLTKIGFEITEKDCLSASKGESVGRPHIVEALKAREHNIRRIEKLRRSMAARGTNDPLVRRKYELMMEQGEQQYPYVLLLSEDSFIPDIYVDHKYYLHLDETVALIRNAGGVALVAHYDSATPKVSFEKLEELIRDNRIDGAESVFGLWSLGTGREEEIVKTQTFIRGLHSKYHCLPGGGADVHREDDLRDFALRKSYSVETRGMTKALIESGKIDISWSSFT